MPARTQPPRTAPRTAPRAPIRSVIRSAEPGPARPGPAPARPGPARPGPGPGPTAHARVTRAGRSRDGGWLNAPAAALREHLFGPDGESESGGGDADALARWGGGGLDVPLLPADRQPHRPRTHRERCAVARRARAAAARLRSGLWGWCKAGWVWCEAGWAVVMGHQNKTE